MSPITHKHAGLLPWYSVADKATAFSRMEMYVNVCMQLGEKKI